MFKCRFACFNGTCLVSYQNFELSVDEDGDPIPLDWATILSLSFQKEHIIAKVLVNLEGRTLSLKVSNCHKMYQNYDQTDMVYMLQ
jgi:hypothetical protein